ncbi:MAG: 5'-methylthioadenosine/adenosylhomocysteine nucleosidase [Clostridiales bacterium]|jgi:adenosylhomocysteine nucleosidase|nr:5'-methylthioadenosine/adenosylhomocysteine nucleosidase [Clostridiales bacterium]
MTGIICAMDIEARRLLANMRHIQIKTISGITFHCGQLCGHSVVVGICGMGKVFAAVCAQTLALLYAPQRVINSGVAGGISDTLRVGDIVVADRLAQHDFDVTALSGPLGKVPGLEDVFLNCDPGIAKRLLESAADIKPANAVLGAIASGDQFINSDARRALIRDTFQAIACDMEGAAIAQVCFINQIPFGVIRAVSDSGDDDSGMEFHEFCLRAANNSTTVLMRYLSTLDD